MIRYAKSISDGEWFNLTEKVVNLAGEVIKNNKNILESTSYTSSSNNHNGKNYHRRGGCQYKSKNLFLGNESGNLVFQ